MRRAVLLAFILSPVALAAQSYTLTIDDLLSTNSAGYGRARDIIETPDHGYIVSEAHGNIVLHPVRGGDDKPITSEQAQRSELQLSPDGRNIAYVRQGQVWVASLADGKETQLTRDPAGPGDPRGATDHHPQWNPKGKWILYESGQKGFNELYVVGFDGGKPALLAATEIYRGRDEIKPSVADRGDAVSSDRFDPRPHWSPDGTRISYTERSREFFSGKLKILPFDSKTGAASGRSKDIYIAKNDPGGAWAINTAAWSPDNSTLAVVLQETHWDKIWLIPAAGGEPHQLTFGEGEDEEPVFSPDGKWIAFESNRNLAEERHIWVVPSAGGEPRRVTKLEGIEGQPHWADSTHIRFQWRSTTGASAAYVQSIDGTSDPQLFGEVHHSKLEDTGIHPEIVRYRGKDGLQIAGILYKPAGYHPGRAYPALVLPHGGPEGQVILTSAPWSVFLAQHGYVVLEPNFRGSTGYGERFRNANVEDSGGGEIDDIQASVDYLVRQGLADKSRVGISGGSHGGTVVANAVAKLPDTFAVGIEKFGVVDRALFLRYTNRNSAIRWETKMGGPPEVKPAVYGKANVLTQVANIKTPLLILHGAVDPQVPPQESDAFADALKKAAKQFTYISYPGEGHGFQQAEHRRDAYERELAFLDRYLKTEAAAQ